MKATEIPGVSLPDTSSMRGAPLASRLEFLKEAVKAVEEKCGDAGLSQEEALAFLRHFKPVFDDIRLLRFKPANRGGDEEWRLCVTYDRCPHCHKGYDSKDEGKGRAHREHVCPVCTERIEPEDKADE